ncbi:hypothetical protein GQ53DRAFT_490 [Thozetella sp. PMI_491]|nr:hypothetical protein GQ53DRAFT_490 [Thozetella sp. PMI_491]
MPCLVGVRWCSNGTAREVTLSSAANGDGSGLAPLMQIDSGVGGNTRHQLTGTFFLSLCWDPLLLVSGSDSGFLVMQSFTGGGSKKGGWEGKGGKPAIRGPLLAPFDFGAQNGLVSQVYCSGSSWRHKPCHAWWMGLIQSVHGSWLSSTCDPMREGPMIERLYLSHRHWMLSRLGTR